jgi:hypothetical protein
LFATVPVQAAVPPAGVGAGVSEAAGVSPGDGLLSGGKLSSGGNDSSGVGLSAGRIDPSGTTLSPGSGVSWVDGDWLAAAAVDWPGADDSAGALGRPDEPVQAPAKSMTVSRLTTTAAAPFMSGISPAA